MIHIPPIPAPITPEEALISLSKVLAETKTSPRADTIETVYNIVSGLLHHYKQQELSYKINEIFYHLNKDNDE